MRTIVEEGSRKKFLSAVFRDGLCKVAFADQQVVPRRDPGRVYLVRLETI
jgi:hypothetical protein